MNSIEKMEMADRIFEILANGFSIRIFKLWKMERVEPWVYCHVQSNDLRDTPEQNQRVTKGDTPLEAIRKASNIVQYITGQPSITEAADLAQAEDAKHESSPIVEIGPNARCSCGSKRPLLVQRNINFDVDWEMGIMRSVDDLEFITRHPGEIGTCPDCGKAYKFGA